MLTTRLNYKQVLLFCMIWVFCMLSTSLIHAENQVFEKSSIRTSSSSSTGRRKVQVSEDGKRIFAEMVARMSEKNASDQPSSSVKPTRRRKSRRAKAMERAKRKLAAQELAKAQADAPSLEPTHAPSGIAIASTSQRPKKPSKYDFLYEIPKPIIPVPDEILYPARYDARFPSLLERLEKGSILVMQLSVSLTPRKIPQRKNITRLCWIASILQNISRR